MASNFPTSLDNTTSLPTRATGDTVAASDSNDKNSAIIAVETKLGSGASTPTTPGHVLTVTGAGTTAYQAPSGAVSSVAGRTGAVTLSESDISGLVTDLSGKEPTVSAGTTAQYYRGDKSFQALNQDAVPDGTTNKAYSATDKTKLAGIASGATANSSDATLLARANHTGTQSADTLTDGTTNKAFLATERTKLSGVATGATANSSDATLLARANHTGTQLASTISDFSTAADARISAAAGVSVASLSGGKIPSSQIPAVALTSVQTAASQAAQLALTTQEGDVVVRSDTNQTYVRNAGVAGTMADFTLLATPTDAVTSVNGATGVVVLAKGDVGLGNVDNTSDATKNAASVSLTNKTIDGSLNTLSNIPESAVTGLTTDLAAKLPYSGGGLTGTLQVQNLLPDGNLTRSLGTPGAQFVGVYTQKSFLNSTAILDGTTAGIISVTGDIRMAAAGTNSASVATVGGAQTLTGKTIDGASNTFSSVPESAVTNLTTDLAAKASLTGTETLTNKRITKRIEALTDAATVTPASDTNDGGNVAQLSQTSVFANPTGTPTDMQQYILRIKSTSARAISFGTAYRAIGLTLPTTTVAGKMLYIAMQWEAGASKWDVLYVGQEA